MHSANKPHQEAPDTDDTHSSKLTGCFANSPNQTWKSAFGLERSGTLVLRNVVFISVLPNDTLTSVKCILVSVAKHDSSRRGWGPFGSSAHT